MNVLFPCPLFGVDKGMRTLAKTCTYGVSLKGLVPKGPAKTVLAFCVLHRHCHRCSLCLKDQCSIQLAARSITYLMFKRPAEGISPGKIMEIIVHRLDYEVMISCEMFSEAVLPAFSLLKASKYGCCFCLQTVFGSAINHIIVKDGPAVEGRGLSSFRSVRFDFHQAKTTKRIMRQLCQSAPRHTVPIVKGKVCLIPYP